LYLAPLGLNSSLAVAYCAESKIQGLTGEGQKATDAATARQGDVKLSKVSDKNFVMAVLP
jgi:hypothetical protein